MIQREITLLQQRVLSAAGEDVTFNFLPDISVEDLPLELPRHRPDVLHISAHGTAAGFDFANSSGNPTVLKPAELLSFLNPAQPPRLIYLNGCTSSKPAKQMIQVSQMAIGSTELITNRAAMAAAVLFYDRLISGFTVQQSFDAAQAIIRTIHAGSVSAKLFARPGVMTTQERLYQVPRIVAKVKRSAKGNFKIEFGLMGCRHDTVQVVFFTDDETFISEDEDDLESELCLVVRGRPVRGTIWSEYDDWVVTGDFVIHACATTSAGRSYSVSSKASEAIEAKQLFFDHTPVADLPRTVRQALTRLRAEDGSGIAP